MQQNVQVVAEEIVTDDNVRVKLSDLGKEEVQQGSFVGAKDNVCPLHLWVGGNFLVPGPA